MTRARFGGPRAAPVPQRTAAHRQAREVLLLGSILFAFTWTMALLAGWERYSDFVHFYTIGHVATAEDFSALKADATLQAWQIRVLPDSWQQLYPSVYPPQIALLMRPVAGLSYWLGYAVLVGLSIVTCLVTVWRMAATQPSLAQWPRQVALLTAASPFLWTLVVQGQISILALASLFAAWKALSNHRPLLVGAALGLLAYKAPLFIVAMAVVVLAGEMAMVAGGILSAATQYTLAAPWVGWSVVADYLLRLVQLAVTPDRLAAKFVMLHSWRTFWTALLPGSAALVAYAVTASATALGAAWAWRRLVDPLQRTAVLGAAIVLASPHLFAYDLVLLFPLAVASASLIVGRHGTRLLTVLTIAGCFSPMWSLPVALLNLQGSTPVLAAWLVEFVRVARRVAECGEAPQQMPLAALARPAPQA